MQLLTFMELNTIPLFTFMEVNTIQIMTDHEGNRKIYLARGIQEGLETVDYCPTESREPDGFFCLPRHHSLFALLYHYMPTVNKITIHK